MQNDALTDALDNYEARRNAILLEVMEEIYSRLPYGQPFALSDGSIAQMKKFIRPSLRDGEMILSFDVIIEGGKIDHLEFTVKCTGGGGMV